MTDDRALLEAAAKAAGMRLEEDRNSPLMGALGYLKVVFVGGGLQFVPWNPLTDDGDALRLAVKLDICWRRYGNILEVCIPDHGYRRLFDEFVGDDKAAATRRAIVRAAAAMAKS